MKMIKIIAVGLLLVFSLLTFSTLLSGTTVIIQGKGRGETIIEENGTLTFDCVGSVGECKLEIKLPTQ